MNIEMHNIVIRLARPEDTAALRRLGDLEGRTLPAGDVLVAAIDGRILAAVGMTAGDVVSDPFEHTAKLVARLTDARSRLLGESPPRRGLLARLRRLGGSGNATPRAAGAPAVPGSETLLIR